MHANDIKTLFFEKCWIRGEKAKNPAILSTTEFFLVIAPGFEPGTVCLEGRCSIQLSYATIWCANLAILIYYKNKTTISSHTKKPHMFCRAFQFIYFDGSVMIAVISMMMVMVAFFVHFFLHDLFLIIG